MRECHLRTARSTTLVSQNVRDREQRASASSVARRLFLRRAKIPRSLAPSKVSTCDRTYPSFILDHNLDSSRSLIRGCPHISRRACSRLHHIHTHSPPRRIGTCSFLLCRTFRCLQHAQQPIVPAACASPPHSTSLIKCSVTFFCVARCHIRNFFAYPASP